jgi:hypothetical protein
MFYNKETSNQVNRILRDLLFWFTVWAGILSPIFSYAAAVFWPALFCAFYVAIEKEEE